MSTNRAYEDRERSTQDRLGALQAVFERMDLAQRNACLTNNACVYATGSIARAEANIHSDLDLFIVDAGEASFGHVPVSNLESTLLRADLIRASSEAGFPEFSGDGIYLQTHSLDEMIARTGRRSDDHSNSFTARLLLVLESRVLLNVEAHDRAKARVVANYWRDFDEERAFLPVFLINDIMRYWKTICVNYEAARTAGVPSGMDYETWRNKNRLKNVKLKFSRLWTCHATVAYLLHASRNGRSVGPEEAAEMMSMTPKQRLEVILQAGVEEKRLQELLDMYSWFLATFGSSREESFAWIGQSDNWEEARARGVIFGDTVAELITRLGEESSLHRYLLV